MGRNGLPAQGFKRALDLRVGGRIAGGAQEQIGRAVPRPELLPGLFGVLRVLSRLIEAAVAACQAARAVSDSVNLAAASEWLRTRLPSAAIDCANSARRRACGSRDVTSKCRWAS